MKWAIDFVKIKDNPQSENQSYWQNNMFNYNLIIEYRAVFRSLLMFNHFMHSLPFKSNNYQAEEFIFGIPEVLVDQSYSLVQLSGCHASLAPY